MSRPGFTSKPSESIFRKAFPPVHPVALVSGAPHSPRPFAALRRVLALVIARKAQEDGKPALVFPSSRTLSPFPSQKILLSPLPERLLERTLRGRFAPPR